MYNFLERYWLLIILIAVVLTRLPFLWTGYGADADAWLVANSASMLWNNVAYLESRLPGYPLHEIISAPLVGLGGAPLSNAAALIATLFAIIVWSKIVHMIGQHKKLLALAFAFAPVVWQHSAVTLDYIWSLLFILISLHAILRHRFLLAGIALGISIGFRPSNLVAIVPFLCLMYLQKQNIRQVLIFILSILTVTVCAFFPLIMKYGIQGWIIATRQEMNDVHPQFVMRFIAFFYRTIYFIGPLAVITSGYLFWKRKKDILTSIRLRDPIIVTSVVGISTYLALFLWLPLERAYLLPALPFLLLLIDRFSTERAFILFTAVLMLSALVSFDVIDAKERRSLKFNLHPGMVMEEFLIRKELLLKRNTTASLTFNENVIIMTSSGPDFWFENELLEPVSNKDLEQKLFYTHGHFKLTQQKGNSNVLFIAYLKKDELATLRNANFKIYCLSSVKNHIGSVVGYTMESQGITLK